MPLKKVSANLVKKEERGSLDKRVQQQTKKQFEGNAF